MRMRAARPCARTRPKLLLMDEPFAALDEITRFSSTTSCCGWRREGCTVIFVTHSVYESAYLSTRLAVMGSQAGPTSSRRSPSTFRARRTRPAARPGYLALRAEASAGVQRPPRRARVSGRARGPPVGRWRCCSPSACRGVASRVGGGPHRQPSRPTCFRPRAWCWGRWRPTGRSSPPRSPTLRITVLGFVAAVVGGMRWGCC